MTGKPGVSQGWDWKGTPKARHLGGGGTRETRTPDTVQQTIIVTRLRPLLIRRVDIIERSRMPSGSPELEESHSVLTYGSKYTLPFVSNERRLILSQYSVYLA